MDQTVDESPRRPSAKRGSDSPPKRRLPALPVMDERIRRVSAPEKTASSGTLTDGGATTSTRKRKASLISTQLAERIPIEERPEVEDHDTGSKGDVASKHPDGKLSEIRRLSVPSLVQPFGAKSIGAHDEAKTPVTSPYRRVSRRRRSSVRPSDTQVCSTLELSLFVDRCSLEQTKLRRLEENFASGSYSLCVSRHGRVASCCAASITREDGGVGRKLIVSFDNSSVSLPITLAALQSQSSDPPRFLRKDIDLRLKHTPAESGARSQTLAKTSVDVSQWIPYDQVNFCRSRSPHNLDLVSSLRQSSFTSATLHAAATWRVLKTSITGESGLGNHDEDDLSDIR